jgi:hypothetical protein
VFAVVKTVIASASTGSKGLESRGTHTIEQTAGAVFISAQDPLTLAEASPGPGAGALDAALSSHYVVVDCDNVCSLLAEGLQDMSFAALVLCIALLIVLFLTLDYFSIGCFFNEGC